MIKRVEYRVYRDNNDVDHVSWRDAKKIIEKPEPDIFLIERVQRWWYDDGTLIREETKVLYEVEKASK